MKKCLKLSCLTLLVIFLMFSCPLSQTGGTLVLNLSMQVNRTILPEIDMEPVSYLILCTDAYGRSHEVASENALVEIPDLAQGEWDFEVNALNKDGIIIGYGELLKVVITGGVKAEETVLIKPLYGPGDLKVDVTWTPTCLAALNASLVSPAGEINYLAFPVSSNSGNESATLENIASGYYTLFLNFTNECGLPAGYTEVVRIVAGETTTAQFAIKNNDGSSEIGMTVDMENPIEITLTGDRSAVQVGTTFTVSASVPGQYTNLQFAWYLDGALVSTEQAVTLKVNSTGNHTLTMTAFTADGLQGGSAGFQFNVTVEDLTGYWDKSNFDEAYFG